MAFQSNPLNPIAAGTSTSITGTYSTNPSGFMAHGDGQKQGVRNFVGHSMLQA
jgi:hypothetical protein